jgi:hypothetical protein
VTNVSSGNLSGLFTVSVANPTTTPAISFTLALPGTNGQLLYNNNGAVGAEDPVVSQPTASLLNAQVVGNIASGAADSGNPVKIGGAFNTTQPTVTTGQRVDAQMSARGEQLVAPGVSGFAVTVSSGAVTTTPPANASSNVAQIAGTATDVNSGNKSAGTIRVVIATDQPSLTNAQPVSGTFWQATQPISAASLPLPAGAALDTSVTGLEVAQGSTTSGQKGAVILGAVTTAAPSYTTGQSSPLSLTLAGALRTDSSAVTQPVSGTFWQATQPVSLAAAVDVSDRAARLVGQVEGRAASGAAKAGNPVQMGGVFNTTQPTVTTGQAVEAQFSARGAAIVATGADVFNVTVNAALPTGANTIGAVTQASGPWTSNVTQLNSVALGSPSNYGTSPGAVSVPGVNAFITNTPPVSQSGAWTVTANLGTLNGAALDASVTGLEVAQGSTTSGQKGAVILGAVTTAAPSYTTAQSSPLSLTLAGALRTDSSAVTQPVSGTFWQATQPVSGTVTTTPPANASTNITQVNSVALGSPSNYGTSPGAVAVPGVNAFITNTPTVYVQPIGLPLPPCNPVRVTNCQHF